MPVEAARHAVREGDLATARDLLLEALSANDVSAAIKKLDPIQQRALCSMVGLKVNPQHMRRPMGPLVQVRLPHVKERDRGAAAELITLGVIHTFRELLGEDFRDPAPELLTSVMHEVVHRHGDVLSALSLVSALEQGAPASATIKTVFLVEGDASGTSIPSVLDDNDTRASIPVDIARVNGRQETSDRGDVEQISPAVALPLEPLSRLLSRVERAKADSDATYYTHLLYLGEFLTKLLTLTLTACLEPDKDETDFAYSIQYRVVRADSIGTWVAALQDLTTAPVMRMLYPAARPAHVALTQRFSAGSEAWQRRAVDLVRDALNCFPALTSESQTSKLSLGNWFQSFAALRNKTRGHGADLISWQSNAIQPLRASLRLLLDNSAMTTWPWGFAAGSASGKFKWQPLTPNGGALPEDVAAAGIHVRVGDTWRRIELFKTDADLSDFFLPNGDAHESTAQYEQLSYSTGSKIWGSLKPFTRPPRALPSSETEGAAEIRVVGNVLTNVPEHRVDYVRRASLEAELEQTLLDDRHPVVAINGPGGIGKTSLTIQVLHDLADIEAFSAILWFSARDIDLDPVAGPRPVKPRVQSLKEVARQHILLTGGQPGNDSEEAFLEALQDEQAGPVLFVFDNFETVHSPVELYRDVNSYIRLPNKVLITTRYRDFKGDYPVVVGGMSRDEFDSLVTTVASRLNISGLLQAKQQWLDSLFAESGGHPYAVKVALGEVAKTRRVGGKFGRIMASRDDILDALFERSFNRLSDDAQRIFFTLCRWRTMIPSVALEAVMLRPANAVRFDVEHLLDELVDSSLVERAYSDVESQSFLVVPAAAQKFGLLQLKFYDSADDVDRDARFLRMFGPVSDNVISTGFGGHVARFFDACGECSTAEMSDVFSIGEYLARAYPEAWLSLANLQLATGTKGRRAAKRSFQNYLARHADDGDAWLQLASICADSGDQSAEVRAMAEAAASKTSHRQLSTALGRFFDRVERGSVVVDSRAKRQHLRQFCDGWHQRTHQATLRDCRLLAKLAQQIEEDEEALYWIESGLRLDRRDAEFRELQALLSRRLR